jgi:hypothetical protein
MLICAIITNVYFRNIQSLLAILARASLCMGLESIVESWVSVLEFHSSKIRNLSQERLCAEAMIAINGPTVVNCDSVVAESLDSYSAAARRAGGGGFIRRSENMKSYMVSKAVDTLVNKPPAVLFMT